MQAPEPQPGISGNVLSLHLDSLASAGSDGYPSTLIPLQGYLAHKKQRPPRTLP